MAEIGDLHVKITAEDHVSPVLRRIRRELFWMRYGDSIAAALVGALVGAIIFAAGVLFGVSVR